ncbi:MAG: hypothetical protein M1839_006578 [Geoglossum umbratile]|nr:MAG: hypothetical protein M1839_006578 [Geoglossum umbratile]
MLKNKELSEGSPQETLSPLRDSQSPTEPTLHTNETSSLLGYRRRGGELPGEEPLRWYEVVDPPHLNCRIPFELFLRGEPLLPLTLTDAHLTQSSPLRLLGNVAAPADSGYASPTSVLVSQTGDPNVPWMAEQPTAPTNNWAYLGRTSEAAQSPLFMQDPSLSHTRYSESSHATSADSFQNQVVLGLWDHWLDYVPGSPPDSEEHGVHPRSMPYTAGLDDDHLPIGTGAIAPVPADDRQNCGIGDVSRSSARSRRKEFDDSSRTDAGPAQHVEPLQDDSGNWLCSRCSKSYNDFSNCTRHIKGAHGLRGKPRQIYLCPECGKLHSRLDNLKSHLRRTHRYAHKNVPHVRPISDSENLQERVTTID